MTQRTVWWETDTFTLFKPGLRLAAVAALFETALVATLFSAANVSATTPLDQHFIVFLLALTGYVLMVREFKKRLHIYFEMCIAQTRLDVMDRVRQAEVWSLEQIGAESIATVLTLDLKAVSELSYTIASTVYALFLLAGVLIYLAVLSEYALLLTVVSAVLVGSAYAYNQYRITHLMSRVRDQETRTFTAVHDLLEGFKALRLNNKKSDAFFHQNLQPHITRLHDGRLQIFRHLIDNYALTYTVWKLFIIAPVLILPVVGITSQQALMTFIGIILVIPVNYLVDEIPRIMLASISIQRLHRLEQTLTTLTPESAEVGYHDVQAFSFERLTCQNLTFYYQDSDGRPFCVGPITLSVQAGEIVFITGGNGSGKTTLLKLLTGLYRPAVGQFLLNGNPVDIQAYRDLFAAIFTDFHLFDRLYGQPEQDAVQVNVLLECVRLADSVQFRDGQFSTLDLSTGQRKRLALVVALLEDKPVYVFDEWAAEQDPPFREYFYRQVLPDLKAQGKAVLAVTHDDHYFGVADRIVKMEEGQIVAV